jgi:hypothetical protein
MVGEKASGTSGSAVEYYVRTTTGWKDRNGTVLNVADWPENASPKVGADLLTCAVTAEDADRHITTFDELGFDRSHPRFLGNVLPFAPSKRRDALEHLFAADIGPAATAFELRSALFPADQDNVVRLDGGNDGSQPTAEAYRAALQAFDKIDDISIVAAPDSAVADDLAQQVWLALINHAERRRAYRIAVLDAPFGKTPTEMVEMRGNIDSTYAALYYPWINIANPLARPGDARQPAEVAVPPSGFITGIYARNDVQHGVSKAPANEVLRGAFRLEQDINFAQQELLNPRGVNCLRFFPGRGYRVWGARTTSSDSEWKYVNVRRYFNYLERSIDGGTQWVVFESNNERLWANVRETIASFLYTEWVNGALMGETPKEAFFVRCDRSTMTENDISNGRLICLIGVAAVKPAEFVIFRIGQKTAESRA